MGFAPPRKTVENVSPCDKWQIRTPYASIAYLFYLSCQMGASTVTILRIVTKSFRLTDFSPEDRIFVPYRWFVAKDATK